MRHPDDYLYNRAYELPEDMRQTILEAIDRLAINPYARKQYLAVMKFLREDLQIFVDYDWVGHRGEWFFPTVADAEAQEDWEFQCMD